MPTEPLLLTLNAGSSSLKFALFAAAPELPLRASGQIQGLGVRGSFSVQAFDGYQGFEDFQVDLGAVGHAQAVHAILGWLEQKGAHTQVVAVSHRVVHGGADHAQPARADDALLADLQRLVPLAPLHQPHNLAGLRAARTAFPGAQQIACFDTAFHRTHPFVADTFALPRSFYDEGVRRYGFHGLSYEFMARRLRNHDPALARGRVIVAHLGNGASMCAMRDGRSVASTMGFTAMDGLPMGTRCGQLDPGVVLYLLNEKGMTPAAISDLLYQNAGLKGISGLSHDVRDLLASASPAARDALVLTGGIGENAASVRAMMLDAMQWMGIDIDPQANQQNTTVISRPPSRVQVLVFRTDEERMLAEHAAELMAP